MKWIVLVIIAACAAPPTDDMDTGDDADLDADADLAALLADTTPEQTPADTVPFDAQGAACTKTRYLHVATYSWVPPLHCVGGECSNGCWGAERRTSGFTCEYSATHTGYVVTDDNGGPFASYNEIKSLNAHDAIAVANCRSRGGRPVRTYTAWNGAGWNAEGITASVSFAELYGTQADASSDFWTWYNHARGSFAPMGNVSPETHVSFAEVKALTARLCSATRDEWAGLYFYDGQAVDGAGMADWKAAAIIRGMNYCTTH
jgi:hypothetical protein